MKFTYLAVAALIAAFGTTTATPVQASTKDAPAEFPPLSYQATQYVDSRGCVYIRAGVDGSTTWVPRLTRQRKHICGMEPTRLAGTTASNPAARSAQVEQITIGEADAVAPVEVVARSAPARTEAAAPAQTRAQVTPARTATVRRTVAAPTPTVASAPTPDPVVRPEMMRTENTPAPVTRAVRNACNGAQVKSSTYIRGGSHIAVRCYARDVPQDRVTAQAVAPTRVGPVRDTVRVRKLGAPLPETDFAGSTRVVPLHVYRQRVQRPDFKVPNGYRLAWEDDRLNHRRAEGTLDGWNAMNLKWTRTTPSRLIDRTTGQDVTADIALVYPFTDFTAQRSQLGDVTLISRNGQRMKRILRNPGAPSAKELEQNPDQVVASSKVQATSKPVYISRSKAPVAPKAVTRAVPKSQAPAEITRQYVQVGLFGVPSNAESTAQRLARMGLPVRISKQSRGGKTFRTVMAGPFADDGAARKALSAVRRAGFADAYLRR